MNFMRSRAEHLADFLREQIHQRQLPEPLPSTRVWSKQLGVGRPTLETALRQLSREGILSITPRGSRLRLERIQKFRSTHMARQMVRILYRARDFPESQSFMAWIAPLSDRLHFHGIQLTVEKCSDAKLRTIAHAKSRPDQLVFLLGMAGAYQRIFEHSRHAVLVLGEPLPGGTLPFLTDDQNGAVRHATQRLLRRGFSRISLVIAKLTSPGIRQTISLFLSTCSQWPHQPIQPHVTQAPLDLESLRQAFIRLATRIRGKWGFVVVAPVPVGMLMTAILQRGLAIPRDVELAAVLHGREALQLCPAPILYSSSTQRTVTGLVKAALHYFETGRVPALRKRLAVEPA